MKIVHLFQCPEHTVTVARWIHEEWWKDKPGHTVGTMEARLREASRTDRIPLSLVALLNGAPVGTVNLVENDNESRTDLSPWLAALFVPPECRGRGVGTRLVTELVAAARTLSFRCMYLGTDIPEYYERFGAGVHEQVSDTFSIMRLETTRAAQER